MRVAMRITCEGLTTARTTVQHAWRIEPDPGRTRIRAREPACGPAETKHHRHDWQRASEAAHRIECAVTLVWHDRRKGKRRRGDLQG